jgi:adenosylcobyric acid synthase
MVCGTTSDAGKSHVVTGLCRLLARRGISVAPFKAQNMALNSYVTSAGHEVGRAQGVQALAAGVEPDVAMNPILVKPTGDRASQVIVNGTPIGHLSAAGYHDLKPQLLPVVLDALADLRHRFHVVIVEGAGSPAEINLLDNDIVNLRIAAAAELPAMVVGDIDRGGVFAALYGTVMVLPDHYRKLIRAFLINKFRGDPGLLAGGLDDLERRCGVPTIGVLPFIADVALDAEDSLALDGPRPAPVGAAPPPPAPGDALDVAVIRFPRVANVTDVDALALEPGVSVRLVDRPQALGAPDLVVLPGTKATVADLTWLRSVGLAGAIAERRRGGTVILGICGGYQMLGRTIVDEVESGRGTVDGLGWLDVTTVFRPDKVTRRRSGRALGHTVHGYQIHHGRTTRGEGAFPWLDLDGDEPEGAADGPAAVAGALGTSLHGLFEQDTFRAAFLGAVAGRRGKAFRASATSFAAARRDQFDRLADLLEEHVDLGALDRLIAEGDPPPRWPG